MRLYFYLYFSVGDGVLKDDRAPAGVTTSPDKIHDNSSTVVPTLLNKLIFWALLIVLALVKMIEDYKSLIINFENNRKTQRQQNILFIVYCLQIIISINLIQKMSLPILSCLLFIIVIHRTGSEFSFVWSTPKGCLILEQKILK